MCTLELLFVLWNITNSKKEAVYQIELFKNKIGDCKWIFLPVDASIFDVVERVFTSHGELDFVTRNLFTRKAALFIYFHRFIGNGYNFHSSTGQLLSDWTLMVYQQWGSGGWAWLDASRHFLVNFLVIFDYIWHLDFTDCFGDKGFALYFNNSLQTFSFPL